uniref:Uncharacterized protein n=1 Tax=Neobodo designis TaxID=312471 RepID=A0A7S1QID7_NEODS
MPSAPTPATSALERAAITVDGARMFASPDVMRTSMPNVHTLRLVLREGSVACLNDIPVTIPTKVEDLRIVHVVSSASGAAPDLSPFLHRVLPTTPLLRSLTLTVRLADVSALVHVAGTLEVLRAYRGLPENASAVVAELTALATLSVPTYRISTDDTADGLRDVGFLLQRRHTRLRELHVNEFGGPSLSDIIKACPLLHSIIIHTWAVGHGSGWEPLPIGWEPLNDSYWMRPSFM